MHYPYRSHTRATLQTKEIRPFGQLGQVICLAIRENGVLVSGDGLVRRTAGTLGVDVRGLLWLFDEFVSMNLISPLEAGEKNHVFVIKQKSRKIGV